MKKAEMLEAFKRLDWRLKSPTRIIIGGGAALIAAYQDVDGVPDKTSMEFSDFKEEGPDEK